MSRYDRMLECSAEEEAWYRNRRVYGMCGCGDPADDHDGVCSYCRERCTCSDCGARCGEDELRCGPCKAGGGSSE